MTIHISEDGRRFHLTNGRISHIMAIADGKLVNLYTGAAVPDDGTVDFGYSVRMSQVNRPNFDGTLSP